MGKMNISKKLSFSVRISDDTIKHIHGDTIDELIDAIEELKDVKFIIKFIEEFPNLSKEQFKRLESVVLNSNDIDGIYEYAINSKVILINIEKFEDLLIAIGDNSIIIRFAQCVNKANIEKLEEAVIKSKNKNNIITFFHCIESSNPEEIKKALWDGEKRARDIYNFITIKKQRGYNIEIEEIKEADDIIIASNDASICLEWAKRNIEGINISKLEDVVIKYGYKHYIQQFATYVKGADIEKLEDAIIKIDDAYAIYSFATEVEGANLYKLRKALKASKDQEKDRYIRWWKDKFGMKGIFKSN